MRFRERRVRPRQMEQPEIHDDGVEGSGVEGQRLRVAFLKHQPGQPPAGFSDHRRREVETRDDGAPLSRGAGDEPGTAGDVEQTRALRGADSIQHRPGGLRGQRAEGLSVERRGALPALLLELVKRIRIRGHVQRL